MTTGRDLIKGSFRLLRIYSNSEEPTADEAQDALKALNQLADSLNLDNLMSYQTLSDTYNFVANQAVYEYGVAGDFVKNPAPVEITNVTIRDISNNIDLPCNIITEQDYASITLKTIESPIPFYVMINQLADNNKSLTFWPVPTTSTYGCTIYYQSFVGVFTLDDEIVLPPGYLRMFRYNLAIELAPEYGVSASPEVVKVAKDSLAAIKRQNNIPQQIGVDGAITSGSPYSGYTYADLLIGR